MLHIIIGRKYIGMRRHKAIVVTVVAYSEMNVAVKYQHNGEDVIDYVPTFYFKESYTPYEVDKEKEFKISLTDYSRVANVIYQTVDLLVDAGKLDINQKSIVYTTIVESLGVNFLDK